MKKPQFFGALLTLCLITLSTACFAVEDEGDEPAARSQKAKSVKKKKTAAKGAVFKIDRLRLESGVFLDGTAPDSSNYAHAAMSFNWQPDRQWEFQLGGRLDGYLQTGSPDFGRMRADYTENFIRWRGQGARFTVGTQNILWGRTDEIPPIDRLSRVDLNRFILDGLPDRRRAVPAVRLEKFFDDLKADLVWAPKFQKATLPPWESAWHPVDRRRGRIIGVEPSPALTYLVQNGSFSEDNHGAGGGGIRITQAGGGFDWGLSLQRARQSAPYYQLNPALRVPLLSGSAAAALASVTGPTFTAIHPMSTVAGAELELQGAGATWRVEAAYSSDVPATTQDLRYLTKSALDLVAGAEFFPGDGETRATIQLAAHQLRTNELLLERKNFYGVTGELEHPFGQGRWRANLRFVAGINHRDRYLNPKLAYLGFEPYELYLGAHFFSGDDRGLGGFHRDHEMIVLGWQVRY